MRLFRNRMVRLIDMPRIIRMAVVVSNKNGPEVVRAGIMENVYFGGSGNGIQCVISGSPNLEPR